VKPARPINRAHPRRILLPALYGLLLAFGCLLLFYNLDGRLLWGDEAETATLARNVVRFGYPKSFDGLNRISLYGAEIDNAADAWVWSPWLQQYVTAASFSLFGPTTWAARAPFALIGWFCLPLLGWVVYRIYRNQGLALASMALLASSEIFLLHARQCRYYSITVLGEILFVYSLYLWLGNDQKGRWLLLLSLLVQFYSNYIVAVANLPVLLLLAWNLYRREKAPVVRLGLCLALLVLLAAPWVLYARLWRQSSALSERELPAKVVFYLSEFHFHFAPLVIGILPLACWLTRKLRPTEIFKPHSGGPGADEGAAKPGDKAGSLVQPEAATVRDFERHVLVLLPSYALIITLAPVAYVRYLLPVLPAACLLSAVWVFRYLRWRFVAVGSIVVLCLTNALAVGTGYPWRGPHKLRWPLFDFVGGLTAPYHERLADVVTYLDREARPGQTIFVFDPEFPLIFYTPCQIMDARLRGGMLPEQLPDWILSESASGVVDLQPLVLSAPLQPFYETITLPVHASTRMGCTPDPDGYQYHSAAIAPYVLYRRKGAP
jgi:4-amino-4-deoxy-L-arabinose transferase-like glycosyltransferase